MRKPDKERLTFTKILMIAYSTAFMLWITWSYILATMEKNDIAEDLSANVVTVGVAAVIGYLMKSYFETHSEEYNKLKREQWKHEVEIAKHSGYAGEEMEEENDEQVEE